MKASDLRIGNWYKWYAEGKYYYYQIEAKDFTSENLRNFEPIELTEEWLFKLGFKNEIPLHWFNKVIINDYKGGFIEKMYGMEIKYAHQLQNLYFALCGEELQLKLSK